MSQGGGCSNVISMHSSFFDRTSPCTTTRTLLASVCTVISILLASDLPRANLLHPLSVAADRRKVLVTILRDQDDVLDAHATDALVALEHLLVDVLGVAHRSEKVGGEVNAWLDRLHSALSIALSKKRRSLR